MALESSGSPIAVGIDAAIVADHHVTFRRPGAGGSGEILDRFRAVPSTMAGLDCLTQRLAEFPHNSDTTPDQRGSPPTATTRRRAAPARRRDRASS